MHNYLNEIQVSKCGEQSLSYFIAKTKRTDSLGWQTDNGNFSALASSVWFCLRAHCQSVILFILFAVLKGFPFSDCHFLLKWFIVFLGIQVAFYNIESLGNWQNESLPNIKAPTSLFADFSLKELRTYYTCSPTLKVLRTCSVLVSDLVKS